MKLRKSANELMKLSYRAERVSMLLHWPLFWISSAMHSMASLLDSQARKRVEAIRDEYWDTFPVGELQRLRGLADIRPSDVTGAQRKEAFEAGAASAKAVLAESSNPLLMSNELCDDELSGCVLPLSS